MPRAPVTGLCGRHVSASAVFAAGSGGNPPLSTVCTQGRTCPLPPLPSAKSAFWVSFRTLGGGCKIRHNRSRPPSRIARGTLNQKSWLHGERPAVTSPRTLGPLLRFTRQFRFPTDLTPSGYRAQGMGASKLRHTSPSVFQCLSEP